MVYLSDNVMTGGYAGGALISDRWVLTAGRNLFVRKSREDIQGKEPLIPKVYLGITRREEATASMEVPVEKVSYRKTCACCSPPVFRFTDVNLTQYFCATQLLITKI